MEAACSSKILAPIHQNIRFHKPEDYVISGSDASHLAGVQALQENQTKFLNCLNMDPHCDLLSLLSQKIDTFGECRLVINVRTV
jgi:hypothetical protein